MNGGITFCALVPMRSVPFRVLCMVGMNEASFPASESQAEFNILKNKGQADRTVEDRHLFLESLLCAGDYLHISYTGENAEGPPRSACSPVVELLKNMDSIFGSDLRRPVSESILIRHRMQSFHPDYFREDRTLYSYSRAGFRAAAAFLKPDKKNRPFLSKQLASFQEEAIQISSIISYYKYPSRTFLRQALGVDYFEDAELPDEEINLADGLTGFRLKEKALQFVLKGKKTDEIIENLLNSGLIFASSAGRFQIRRLLYETDSFFRTAAAIFENKSGEFSPESLHLKQFYRPVRGSLRFASPAAHVYIRPGSLSARFLLEAWVLHLAASLHFKNPNLTTLLCGTQSKEGFNLGLFRLASSIDAKSEFEYLLEFRKIGLVRPAPFFPLISLRFAEAQNDEARKKALVVLENDIGEEEELLFPDIAEELHGEEFQNISRRIFGPLLKSLHRDLEFDSIAEIIGGRKDVR